MTGRTSLEDLQLTGDEVERLTKAFQDEGFRSLFAEYAAELNDPAQRAIYEAEVAALERQRGVEARFIHPEPGWVLRTSQAGTRRCYLNVCSNPQVGRPESRPEPGGSRWSLPHCLAPGREELGRRRDGQRGPHRLVYDVVFHPEALRLAARSPRFRRLVDDTALEAVENHFSPGLDRANAVPLRGTKYKGVPHATLLRTPLPGGAQEPPDGGEGDSPLPAFPTPYSYPPPKPASEAAPPSRPPPPAAATTPRWTLQHRSYVDLQDYRYSRDSAPSPVPRELVVTVELPLLSSAAQAQLEIREQELQLDSQRPAAYRLRLPLPYAVDEGSGRATFNKARKQLVVTLPVLRKPGPAYLPSDEASLEKEEEEQEEPAPSSESGSSNSCKVMQEDAASIQAVESAGLLQDTEQASPVTHVEVSPVCAVKIAPTTPAAVASTRPGDTSDVPQCPAMSSPAPPEGHVRAGSNTSELPLCAVEIVPAGPCVANCSAAPPVCKENSPPDVPPCANVGSSSALDVSVRHEGIDSVSPAPSVRIDTKVELPEHSSTTDPATGVSQMLSCTDMDLNKGPDFTSAVPPPCPSDTMAPCVDLCDSMDHSVATALCLDCSNIDQRPEFSTGRDLTVPLVSPNTISHVEDSVPAPPCPRNRTSDSPLLSTTGLSLDTDALTTSASFLDSPVRAASTAPLCPPFHCTQDDKSLTLLLEFPPENKLSPPEFELDVSLSNAVISLTKSPETTGLWTKLYFGSNADSLQERWFVTEDNVDAFLGSLPSMSCSSQSEMEHQPLIEVLDVSEGKSQIRLKAQEQNSFKRDKIEGRVNPQREDGGQENGSELSTDAESCPMQGETASHSLISMETMGQVGGGLGHCLELDPSDPNLARPEKVQIRGFHESELAFTTSKRATSTAHAELHCGDPAQTGGGEDARSESAQNNHDLGSRPAPPVLKETDMQNGSVQYIRHHTTHCVVTFENTLLYELD
ncbi:protein kintoun isoform X2 [Rhineura floridana]|uniref:protein kintoun isoform X2 n=1 Tax=Rhineura floridana TaxID=261503 RepID=UPI002AC857F9|nr:protein kintoun isoform X2 [Rhineura floridana]